MAHIMEPTPEMLKEWGAFVEGLPECIRDIGARLNPWTLYRLKDADQRVLVVSINENRTVTVFVSGEYNRTPFEREVFGIDPDDLEECDLPGPHEVLGAALTGDEVAENIDAIRVAVRPDLFEMGADGKAVARRPLLS